MCLLVIPTRNPTSNPRLEPTQNPTINPTLDPTNVPTIGPTSNPSNSPTKSPLTAGECVDFIPVGQVKWYDSGGQQYDCTWYGTLDRCAFGNSYWNFGMTGNEACCVCGGGVRQPSLDPSSTPTGVPSNEPSGEPSLAPTNVPSSSPTLNPITPTSEPTCTPSTNPSLRPTESPTLELATCTPVSQGNAKRCSGLYTQYEDGVDLTWCSTQAQASGMLYFSFRHDRGRCRVPTTDDIDQCVANPLSVISAWHIYFVQCPPTFAPTNAPSKDPTKSPTFRPTFQPTRNPSGNFASLFIKNLQNYIHF